MVLTSSNHPDQVNELPKELRFKKKYMLTAYVCCRKEKPNIKILMAPLVDKINQMYEQGIQFETLYGSQHVHSILFMVSADLPARAELMNINYTTGNFLVMHVSVKDWTYVSM